MLCDEFENRLTDYLDGALTGDTARAFAAHALRCPLCHTLLSEVKNTITECRSATPPPPSAGLETRILMQTAPGAVMTCDEFEDCLTDYLDGFLPAHLYHRWERHAALCAQCTELPGQVVRAIGACYSYINEERAVPVGLHARILEATLGTTNAGQVRAPWSARVAMQLRRWLDTVVSPQLATVATMALIAVLVGTNTVSDDGSISGMYRASLRLAARTYEHGASTARSTALPGDLKRAATVGLENLIGDAPRRNVESEAAPQPTQSPQQSPVNNRETSEQQ